MGVIEQRNAARFEVEVAAEVYSANAAVLPANTRNLSNTGCCIETTQGLEENSTIGVSLFLTTDGIEDPDTEPLNVKAVVMWATEVDESGFTAGVRFEDMTEENTVLLQQFLEALAG